MSAPVDVLAVLRDPHYDLRPADDFAACAEAVAELVEDARLSANALEKAADAIGGDLALLLRDRVTFLRAALAKFGEG